VHVLGLEAVAAVPSAAHAAALHTAPAATRIVAATMPSLVMRAPCFSLDNCHAAKVFPQARIGHSQRHMQPWQEDFVSSGSCAT
jgi:hypothetical protein